MIFLPKTWITLSLVFTSVCIITPIYAKESGTWKDSKTSLTWQRCSLGQTWNGYDCDGEPRQYTWEDAQQAANAVGKGWRVPAASELMSLVRCNTGFQNTSTFPDRKGVNKTMPNFCNEGVSRPTIDTTIFPNTPDAGYWSSSPVAVDNDYAWFVGFSYGGGGGYARDGLKSYNHYVRLVRASQ